MVLLLSFCVCFLGGLNDDSRGNIKDSYLMTCGIGIGLGVVRAMPCWGLFLKPCN